MLTHERFNDALGTCAAFLDLGLCMLLAERLDCSVHVASCLGEELLRFHHAGLCFVPQVFDHCGGNICHSNCPLNFRERPPRPNSGEPEKKQTVET